jgi:hypothetical protein
MTDRGEHGTSFWVIFASAMLALGSLSHLSAGMTMVFNTNWVLATSDYTSASDVQTLGWINLGIGALMILSAWGVLARKTWARAVGVVFGVLVVVNGISVLQLNLAWGILTIAVGVGVVFALTVKGAVVAPDATVYGEVEDGYRPLEPELPGEIVTEDKPDY